MQKGYKTTAFRVMMQFKEGTFGIILKLGQSVKLRRVDGVIVCVCVWR